VERVFFRRRLRDRDQGPGQGLAGC
jgi:hypothetical protein